MCFTNTSERPLWGEARMQELGIEGTFCIKGSSFHHWPTVVFRGMPPPS